MADIHALLRRNEHFATTHEGGPIYPRSNVCVITCLDPRTDPANFLELGVGDAVVIRNAGGRVTQALIDDLAFITYLSETVVKPDGPPLEVAVIHHNKCGTHFLANADFRHAFEAHVGAEDKDAELAARAVTDPKKTVRNDVELLLSSTSSQKGQCLGPRLRCRHRSAHHHPSSEVVVVDVTCMTKAHTVALAACR
jgi:carbonic anhydrase